MCFQLSILLTLLRRPINNSIRPIKLVFCFFGVIGQTSILMFCQFRLLSDVVVDGLDLSDAGRPSPICCFALVCCLSQLCWSGISANHHFLFLPPPYLAADHCLQAVQGSKINHLPRNSVQATLLDKHWKAKIFKYRLSISGPPCLPRLKGRSVCLWSKSSQIPRWSSWIETAFR